MNLYIEIEDGQPKNHPTYGDNLVQYFGNIPNNWEPFVRVDRPVPGVYQILENLESIYQKVDGVWTDVWNLRDMTISEKIAKQDRIKESWLAQEWVYNFSAWVFNEETCVYDPPIPYPDPTGGTMYRWYGIENRWRESELYAPEEGGPYKWDYITWGWVPDTTIKI